MKRTILGLLACWLTYGQTPNPPLSFEVASVKLSPPDRGGPLGSLLGCRGGPGTENPGQYTCAYANFGMLLIQAFDLKPYQLPPIPRDRYDVRAKVPAGATKEQLRTMMQNLLIERFKLKYHFGSKDADVYELAIAKGGPRLKEAAADPPGAADAESVSRSTPGRPSTDSNGCPVSEVSRGKLLQMGMPGRWCVSASAVLIDQLVDVLSNRVGGTVTDATGLKGKYDFKLSFSMARSPSAIPFGNAPMPTEDGAPELDTGPTLLGAVETQLGLKLEKKKGSIELFVIDHVEKVPTEN